MSLTKSLKKTFFPLPADQKKQGFEPNWYIKSVRAAAKSVISVLRLNGENRFSNELMQLLDPKITVPLKDGSGHLTLRTGHGRLLWRVHTFQDEEPILINWINSFKPGEVFYDVGANVGSYSLYAATKGVQAFAVEPEFNNLQLIYENIFLNKLESKCTPIPIAAGNKTHMDVFYLKSISKGDALHSIGRKSYMLDNPEACNYKLNSLVMRLDDIISTFGLPKPDWLKVDVDNNELDVIQGAEKSLEHIRGVLVELDMGRAEHAQAAKILQEKGFRIKETERIDRQFNPRIANYLFVK